MNAASFRKSLKLLGDTRDDAARQRAERELSRYTPEEWVSWVLLLWPAEARRRHWGGLALGGMALLLYLGVLLWSGLGRTGFRISFVSFLLGGSALRALRSLLDGTSHRPIECLLERLDDVRLVPLWLKSLPGVQGARRTAFLAKLARHLPSWHTTGEALPEHARKVLLHEVRRLSETDWSPEAAAFLTAALVSLGASPAQGIPADERTATAIEALRHRGSNDHVRAAAEDALQRLGRPNP